MIMKLFYDEVHVLSSYTVQELNRLGINNFLIYNKIKSVAVNRGSNSTECIRLLSIGRLESVKNTEFLLHVVRLLIDRGVSVCLDILGSGSRAAALERLACDLGLSNVIFFHGHVSNVEDYIEKSDVLVFTSKNEGLPNAVLECVAGNMRVVCSDCLTGPRDILGIDYQETVAYPLIYNGFALCSLPRQDLANLEEYADCIERLMRSPSSTRALSANFDARKIDSEWKRKLGHIYSLPPICSESIDC